MEIRTTNEGVPPGVIDDRSPTNPKVFRPVSGRKKTDALKRDEEVFHLEHKLVRKEAGSPDDTRMFADGKGKMQIFALGESTIGRGVFEPGWRWSQHVKPIAGTPLCQSTHTGYVLEGRMVVKMHDRSDTEFGPGDFFYMPAGHDAWIVGDKRCVILDFTGLARYAKKT